jgi:hypothetical protein
LASQCAAYGQGGPQPDFSAQQMPGAMSAQLQQMPTIPFPPGLSGYNSATNSTTRDQDRLGFSSAACL